MRGSRNFCPGQSDKKRTDNALFVRFFKSSAYFTEVKWLIPKKTIIFNVPEGVQHFPGGGGGGSDCILSVETI